MIGMCQRVRKKEQAYINIWKCVILLQAGGDVKTDSEAILIMFKMLMIYSFFPLPCDIKPGYY